MSIKKLSCGVAAAAMAFGGMAVPQASAQSEPFLGQITWFGGNFAPRGWAFCDGQLLAISSNTALFSILGTVYGGDGRTTFALPDARGRSLVHPGNGPGLSQVRLGERGGSEMTTLTTANMPNHNHTATVDATLHATTQAGTENIPTGRLLADDDRDRIYAAGPADTTMSSEAITATATIGNNGSSVPFNHRSPYVSANCIIALQGIFPSRN